MIVDNRTNITMLYTTLDKTQLVLTELFHILFLAAITILSENLQVPASVFEHGPESLQYAVCIEINTLIRKHVFRSFLES